MLIAHRPVLYMTNSTLHNPTGHSFSAAQVYRLLELSHRYGFHIVEDDLWESPATTPATRRSRKQDTVATWFQEPLTWQPGQLRHFHHHQLAARMISLKMSIGGVTTSGLAGKIYYTMLSSSSCTNTSGAVDRLYMNRTVDGAGWWRRGARCRRYRARSVHLDPFAQQFHAEALADKGLKMTWCSRAGTILSKAADAVVFCVFSVSIS